MILCRVFVWMMVLSIGVWPSLGESDISLSAKSSRSSLPLNESFQITVSLSSQDAEQLPKAKIQVPDIDHLFEVFTTGQLMSYSNINGQLSSKQTIHYQLVPKRVGDFVIPPFSISYQNELVSSDPIKVSIKAAKPDLSPALSQTKPNPLASSPTQNTAIQDPKQTDIKQMDAKLLILKSDLSQQRLYEGDQTVFKLKLYHRVNLWSDISFSQSKFDGFLAQDLIPSPRYIETIDGVRYYVFELMHKTLTPIQSGLFKIPEFEVMVSINPFSPAKRIRSNALPVHVLELPSIGRPTEFKQAIGQFELNQELLQNSGNQFEAFELRLVLSGSGNLNMIPALDYDKTDLFKVYQSQITDSENQRVFDMLVIPQESGELKLPIFSLTAFSPDSGEYYQIQTDEQLIEVQAAQRNQQNIALEDSLRSQSDLRYLKSSNQKVSLIEWLSMNASILFFLNGLILILIGIRFVLVYKGEYFKGFVDQRHRFKMKQRFDDLNDSIQDDQAFMINAFNFLYQVLDDQFKDEFQKYSFEDLKDKLRLYSISSDLLSELIDLLRDLSQFAYQPNDIEKPSKDQVYNRVRSFLTAFYEEVKQ